jgi:hypothetical protein
MPMARTIIIFGLCLIGLGAAGWLMSGGESVTALIPAFFGLPIAVLGWVGRDPDRLKQAGHVAAILALLGLIGSARGVPAAITLLRGGGVDRPTAAVFQSFMAIACGIFLVLAMRSFRQARASRKG